MNDDEARVRARLREFCDGVVPLSDVPAAGRARYRRRVRRRRGAAVLAGVLVVVGASGLGVALSRRPAHQVQVGTRGTSSSVLGTSSSVLGIPTTLPSAPPAPTVIDTTWISDDTGWALTSRSAVMHTVDGGRTWKRIGAAPVPVEPVSDGNRFGFVGCDIRCVGHVRFADTRHGWLFGGAFYETADGGVTWTRVSSRPVVALEVEHGLAYRVVTERDGCPPDCEFRVERAAVGSNAWTPLPGAAVGGDAVEFLYEGPRLYLIGYGNPAGGGEAHVNLLRSADGGATWLDRGDPCTAAETGAEIDTAGMAASPGGQVVALCEPRLGGNSFVVTSKDAGATFSPPWRLPAGVGGAAIATGSPSVIAVVGTERTSWVVEVSHDQGRSWARTLSAPLPQGEDLLAFLGFEDAQTGRVALGDGRLWTTRDGGDTWTVSRP